MYYVNPSYPAYESWSDFKEVLEVKFPPSWVELVSHEEVINNISCKKNDFLIVGPIPVSIHMYIYI